MSAAAEAFVRRVRKALASNQADAVDVVYRDLTGALLAARFVDARAMLRAVGGADLPRAIVLSAVTASRPWREALGDAWADLSAKGGDR